jgi:hypothetical protein
MSLKIVSGTQYILFAVDEEGRIVAQQEYDGLPTVGDMMTFFSDNFDGEFDEDTFQEILAYRLVMALVEDDDPEDAPDEGNE